MTPPLGAQLASRDDWETPAELFTTYDADYHFDLDPCANFNNRVCDRYFDREADGLTQSWKGARVWLHPPHSEPWLWARKAVIESRQRGAIVVALLPARTGEGWWHDFVLQFATSVRYLRGTPAFRLQRLRLTGDGRPLPIGGFAIARFSK